MPKILFLLSITSVSFLVSAHGGGLNAQGCHNKRKTGGYHCHRGSSEAPQTATPRQLLPSISSTEICKITIGTEYYEFKPSETSNVDIKFNSSDGSVNISCS
jgi:hypothetical protein